MTKPIDRYPTYTGICLCHGTEQSGRASVARPDPYFTFDGEGNRVIVRLIVNKPKGATFVRTHEIPSEPANPSRL